MLSKNFKLRSLSSSLLLLGTFAWAQENKAVVDENHKAMQDFNAEEVWQGDTFAKDDHKVLVIQDRRFTKSGRFDLGIFGGRTNSSAFYSSWNYGVGMGYHFNEYFGIDTFVSYHKNSLTEDGKQVNGFLKEYNFPSSKEFQEPKTYAGGALLWSPIYGKFAFFRRSIIHFDFFSTVGLSYLKTKTNIPGSQGGKDQGHLGSLLGVGMRVFMNDHFSLRFDVRNTIYKTTFAPLRAGQPGSKLTRSQYQYALGLYYLFGSGK